VNDVSAALHEVAAAHKVGWVAMHMHGDPRTMQDDPRYDDVVADVRDFLVERAEAGRAAGVEEIWIDPGIGFGKTAAHNLALLAHIDQLVATGWPVLVATSRKRFLGTLLAASDGTDEVGPDDRVEGSLATATWAMQHGVGMVRAHDVRATVEAARVVAA
jgi:dihydropteroate synthase